MPKEQTTLCPKCGFPSQGPRVRPHNCAKRLAHPEHYQSSPHPAAQPANEVTNHKKAEAPGKSQPLTLAKLDAMPLAPVRHPLLSEMTPADLGQAVKGLDAARSQYESLSGTCATLAGLVLIEGKKRLKHGEYLPWLKSHLGKSRECASKYVLVAKEFLKCQPRVTFEQMTMALMDGSQALSEQSLDMTHPMVSAVAGWTKGRTFYELRETFQHRPGGSQHAKCPHCKAKLKSASVVICPKCGKETGFTADEEEDPKAILQILCEQGGKALAQIHRQKAFLVLTPAELDGLIDHAETVATDAKAWRAMPKKDRERALAELLKA